MLKMRSLVPTTHSSSRAVRKNNRQQAGRASYKVQALPDIKVVGVGGSAGRLVGELWDTETLCNLHLLIIDTDVQALSNTFMPDHDRVLIGGSTTKWAGTKGDASLGQDAALESSGDISAALQGADVVMLLAGLGGGTGCGAAPVVADIARQQGALTICVATDPQRQLEQQHHHVAGQAVLSKLQDAVDTLVALPACPSHTGASGNGTGADTQQLALVCLVQGLADLLTGFDRVALEVVEAAVAGCSSALGFATAQGPGSLTRATFAAISTRECLPRLQQATGVLCFIAGAEDLPASQVDEVREVLSSQCSTADTLLVRTLPQLPGLAVSSVAVAVLITLPASSNPADGSGPRVSSSETWPGSLGVSSFQQLADVADAADGDAAAGEEAGGGAGQPVELPLQEGQDDVLPE